MSLVTHTMLVVGGLTCLVNFYLSFLRYPLFKLRGRESQYRWVSGFPLIGSLLVVAALVIGGFRGWLFVLGLVLATIDTGGLHWFVGTQVVSTLRDAKPKH